MGVLSFSKLPLDWGATTIGFVVTVKGGKRLPKGEKLSLTPTAHPYIRVTDFSGFSVNAASIQYIADNIYKKISRYTISSNDVYISIAGSIGIVGMVPDVLDGANLTENAAKLTVDPGNDLIPRFLMYWLSSDLSQREISAQRVQNAQPKLALARIKSLSLPLPPLPEQRRIAAVLSLVQRAIEQQERLIGLTTELKKALMHKLFTEGTRGEPQKQTEIGLVPESWEVVELETTGEVVYGIQAAVANNLEPIGTRILTNKNITLDGDFNLEKINYFELKTKRHFATILQKGDLLFNWRSGSKQHVGKTAYFDLEGEWVHSSFILRIRPKSEINGRYLFDYFNHLRESEYFIKLQPYAINAKFNKSAVNVLPTVVPDREEQDQIAHALDTAQRKIDSAKNKKTSLQDLFRTLLDQLMTA